MIETAVALWMSTVPAQGIDLPPARYDHLYPNVRYVYDYPKRVLWTDGTEGEAWAYTDPPTKPGGVCVIHLSPVGSRMYNQIMTYKTSRVLFRHEHAHCNGWRH